MSARRAAKPRRVATKARPGIVLRVEGREGVRWLGWLFFGYRYWSVLIAHNGEDLHESQVYTTRASRDQTAGQVAEQLHVPCLDEWPREPLTHRDAPVPAV